MSESQVQASPRTSLVPVMQSCPGNETDKRMQIGKNACLICKCCFLMGLAWLKRPSDEVPINVMSRPIVFGHRAA